MGYILPEIPTIHLRVFFSHNASTKVTRFKQLVKKYSVYSLKTFPTGTKVAYRQKKNTQTRPKKAKDQTKMKSLQWYCVYRHPQEGLAISNFDFFTFSVIFFSFSTEVWFRVCSELCNSYSISHFHRKFLNINSQVLTSTDQLFALSLAFVVSMFLNYYDICKVIKRKRLKN